MNSRKFLAYINYQKKGKKEMHTNAYQNNLIFFSAFFFVITLVYMHICVSTFKALKGFKVDQKQEKKSKKFGDEKL